MAARHPSRAEIQAGQLAQLQVLFAAIVPANPFQSRRLPRGQASIANLADFCARVSLTTKQELLDDQAANPPFGTNLSYPLERYTRFSQTSGTTRSPLRWLDTPESWAAMVATWQVVLRESGVVPGDRIMFAFSFGPFLGFWTAFEAAAALGCLCLPGGGLSTSARLQAMRDSRVNVLCCTPTYALRLADGAGEAGVYPHALALKAIIVAGEPGGGIPATRARIEEYWHPARLHDHHGMTEVGPVSFECPKRRRVLHVIESAFLPEVHDPATGTPVEPGQTGELVLTPLKRLGMPLLRYRTGDLVRPSPHGFRAVCACGRSDLALDGGILGRVDDMVIVRGVNVFPSAVEEIVRGCPGVAEYQVQVLRQRGMVELELTIEAADGAAAPAAALAPRVAEALRAALNLRIPVRLAAPGSLPRFEMKARRWKVTG